MVNLHNLSSVKISSVASIIEHFVHLTANSAVRYLRYIVNLGECYACTTKPERPIRLKFTGDVEKR